LVAYILPLEFNLNMAIYPDPNWNETFVSYPTNPCVHELFEQQVKKSPDSVALIDRDHKFTYQQLNSHANRLAQALINRGVSAETIVCCYLSRSRAIIIYTLAIMKAGGTYLLLDSESPRGRLEYILADARPTMIVTDIDNPKNLGKYLTDSVQLSDLETSASSLPNDNLSTTFSSSNPLYIAYTSGSTGQPKGVLISHQSTVNHARAFKSLFHLGSNDRIPLMAPIGFDMAIEEMIPPLVSGCTLIVSSSKYPSMQEFTQEIQNHGFTILNIPAPFWQNWSKYLTEQKLNLPPTLRLVITGSEEIPTKSYLEWRKLNGASAVDWVAAYGTTETTVTSTFYTSAGTDDLTDEPYIPIGKPIANTYAYVLDQNMTPVEVGAEGELYIGGRGVGLGYHSREELTKTRFLADPFIREQGAKMYKTGDLVRYRPDGNLVWLGRTDDQLKLKGLRIEPAEIEAVLNLSPSVDEAIVVMNRRDNKKELVAYILSSTEATFSEPELRSLASHYLAPLMRPSRYFHLDQMPLKASGKIDRNALILRDQE
jgi:amino acid adenylation domain-containing protein